MHNQALVFKVIHLKHIQLPPLTETQHQAVPTLLIHNKRDINQVIPSSLWGHPTGFCTCPSPGIHRDLLLPRSSAVLTQIHSLNCLQPSVHAFEKKASVSIWKRAALGQRRSSPGACRQLGSAGSLEVQAARKAAARSPATRGLASSHGHHRVPRPPEQPSPALPTQPRSSQPLGHALKSRLLNGGL